jgi:hypothetical protein
MMCAAKSNRSFIENNWRRALEENVWFSSTFKCTYGTLNLVRNGWLDHELHTVSSKSMRTTCSILAEACRHVWRIEEDVSLGQLACSILAEACRHVGPGTGLFLGFRFYVNILFRPNRSYCKTTAMFHICMTL